MPLKITTAVIAVLLEIAVPGGTTHASAAFLDLTSVTPGPSGSFAGTLGPVSVTGSITTPDPGGNFVFNGVAGATTYESSTIDNSSPQYSYGDVYTPAAPSTDRVGYTSFSGSNNQATITIAFSAPVTNPVFHVANLDGAQYDFTPTAGLGGLVLLSGNGLSSNGTADGDGLKISGNVISDADPFTEAGQDPSVHPPTSGPRSAYGSVEILGTFTSLTIAVSSPTTIGDGGSFTLSTTSDAFQVRYVANLSIPGDSVINISNTGALNASTSFGTTADTVGAICANVYEFSADEQLVACCSCPITPNGLKSISVRNDLAMPITLTPSVPTALVVKLLATVPVGGTCNNSAAAVTTASLAPGMVAWGTAIHQAPGGTYAVTETGFSVATISAGELHRLGNLCNFVLANGSGFGVCRSCRLGGLGSERQ